jgi:hypothetical protein
MEKVPAPRANRRSFDCASRDETARVSAQDDNFYSINHLGSSDISIHPKVSGINILRLSSGARS